MYDRRSESLFKRIHSKIVCFCENHVYFIVNDQIVEITVFFSCSSSVILCHSLADRLKLMHVEILLEQSVLANRL